MEACDALSHCSSSALHLGKTHPCLFNQPVSSTVAFFTIVGFDLSCLSSEGEICVEDVQGLAVASNCGPQTDGSNGELMTPLPADAMDFMTVRPKVLWVKSRGHQTVLSA